MSENEISKPQIISSESYFSFTLGEVMFSLPVKYVREVFEFESITPIPNSLSYLKGVMNVRGGVVPAVDLRLMFGYKVKEDLAGTQVIILEIPQVKEKPVLLGIFADSVDVVSGLNFIQADSRDYGMMEGQEFVRAVARRADSFILVLNPEKILSYIENEVDKAVNLQALNGVV